ncbi:MAG: hypothetical protein K1X78_07950 [Verrucomicrobiaceae bacterium]|nr:hypothetical protein [Verrucomicrobiaceae bacterium]
MDSHSSSSTGSSGGFWSVANIVLGAALAVFALFWGAVLVVGGISASRKLRAPAVAEAPAAPAPAPAAPAAPAPVPAASAPATTAAAPAVAPAGAVAEITIKPDTINPLAYDTKSFTVRAGQKVKFTFNNVHPSAPQPHNWVLGKPGTKDKILSAAMAFMADPKALEKGYVPDSPDILVHTKLLQPNTSETIEFVAPAAGDYPYVCTFPGHGILMNGVMKVL